MCAVPTMAVLCSSYISWFFSILLRYFLNDFDGTGYPYYYWYDFFTFYMHSISIAKSLYFRIFSASFLITFLPPEIATSISVHIPFSWSRILTSSWMLGMVLSVYTWWFHTMITLPSWIVSTNFSTCSHHCSFSYFTPFPCVCKSVIYYYHYYLRWWKSLVHRIWRLVKDRGVVINYSTIFKPVQLIQCLNRKNTLCSASRNAVKILYIVHIRALISLYQINTNKCTHILLFINTTRHSNMFQPLKGHLQGVYLVPSSSNVKKWVTGCESLKMSHQM